MNITRRVFNHRGLDRSVLTIYDQVEYDSGTRIPAFASLTYAGGNINLYAGTPLGPHREMTPVQASAVTRVSKPRGNAGRGALHEVNQEGIARVVQPVGHYAPIVYRVWPDGHIERVDSPYGDGERAYR